MAHEIWKPIEGFSLYQISNTGKVRTCQKGRGRVNWYELKLRKNHRSGYIYVGLYDTISRKWFRVHRLVYQHFTGCIPDTLVVDHIDNDKQNNHVNNLQLLTKSENAKKYYKLKKQINEQEY